MPRIYLTCRTEDTTHSEFEQVYLRLVEAFGETSILRTAGSGSGDVLYLAELVRSCDALVVVTGRYWLNMMDESGRRLLDDPFDYLYTELVTALADDETWVTLLLVDGTTVPEANELPEGLRGLLRRDRVSVANDAELDAALDSLIERIGMASAGKEAKRPVPKTPSARKSPKSIWRKTDNARNVARLAPLSRKEKFMAAVMSSAAVLALLVCGICASVTVMGYSSGEAHKTALMRDMYRVNMEADLTATRVAAIREAAETATFRAFMIQSTATLWAIEQSQTVFAPTRAAYMTATRIAERPTYSSEVTTTQMAIVQTNIAAAPTYAVMAATGQVAMAVETATYEAQWQRDSPPEIISAGNLPHLALRRQLPIHWAVKQLAFSTDGSIVALAVEDPEVIAFYAPDKNQLVGIFQTPDRLGMALRPDSAEIAWHDTAGMIHIQDYRQQKQVALFGRAYQIEFDGHDRLLLLAGSDGHFEIRNIDGTGYDTTAEQRENFFAYRMANRGGSYAWAFRNNTIQTEFTSDSGDQKTAMLSGIQSFIDEMLISPNGNLLAVRSGVEVYIYRLKPEPVVLMDLSDMRLQTIAFSPNNTLLAAGASNGKIRFFDVNTGEILNSIEAHSGAVTALVFSPDGSQLLSAGKDQTVRLWQVLP